MLSFFVNRFLCYAILYVPFAINTTNLASRKGRIVLTLPLTQRLSDCLSIEGCNKITSKSNKKKRLIWTNDVVTKRFDFEYSNEQQVYRYNLVSPYNNFSSMVQ